MPNRIIKESVCTSDSIDALDWFGEVLFYRLMVSCDDYGRFDGRVAVIKNRLFPLKESLKTADVAKALDRLDEVGLICRYTVDGKDYLYLPTWEHHQTIRAKKSKYPSPAEGMQASESNCMQMNANVPVIQSNPIQSESNPNTNIDEVIDYLNLKIGSRYKHTETNRKVIKARLNDGFTVEDCKTVIDKKTAEWMHTDMEKYLRPETLFRPGKFENYLNAPISKPKNVIIPQPDFITNQTEEDIPPWLRNDA